MQQQIQLDQGAISAVAAARIGLVVNTRPTPSRIQRHLSTMRLMYDGHDLRNREIRKGPGLSRKSRSGLVSVLVLALTFSSALLVAQNPTGRPPSVTAMVLTPYGCSPITTVANTGSVVFDFLNRTGFPSARIQIRPVGGGSPATVLDVTTGNYSTRHVETVSLSAGNYQLTLLGHTRWACPITIK
jgi:hypothetical protein